MSATLNDHEPRLAVLEEVARSTRTAIERMERRLDGIESRLTAIQSDQRSDFRWLLGSGLGGLCAAFALIARLQHWI